MNQAGQKTDISPVALDVMQGWHEYFQQSGLCPESYHRFRSIIYHYYLRNRRSFAWRDMISPYTVFISEVMLQQTQTSRVIPKYDEFISRFPDFATLADASFSDVLRVWKGLGYNRRARYLQESAEIITDQFDGVLPDDPKILVTLPGIGPATAASICTFAFNKPLSFIETNIRTVFIYFFFQGVRKVHDREITTLVENTLDRQRPREWYYGLMDFGVMLKRSVGNLNRKSDHYTKQSRFEGSDRQLRGKILQHLLDHQAVDVGKLPGMFGEQPERIERILRRLCTENLVVQEKSSIRLP